MTDKEFRRLSRAQLIEIIYQLQIELDKANEEKQVLEGKLADKRLRFKEVGNIADAALVINECFRSAQNAAEQYLDEIKAIREDAEAERQRIIRVAKAEAKAIIAGAKGAQSSASVTEERARRQKPSEDG